MQSEKSKMATNPYRGTRDFYPEDMRKLNYIFNVWRKVSERFGYAEYLSPLLEPWELYATKNVSGDEIVNEQLYWFEDRGGRKVAIRPEMTPSVARMVASKMQQLPKPIRWYSIANFMRYERPQKGRLREFFQLNIDVFGEDSVMADAELIEVAVYMMEEFGADENMFEIRLSNRMWFDYWVKEVLSYQGDVLSLSRIIDRIKKQNEEQTKAQLEDIGLNADQINTAFTLPEYSLREVDAVKEKSQGAADLVCLFDLLDERGLTKYAKFDASLMRGFDYYTGNVFEQFDLNSENRRSMFGGGRYDKLVDIFDVGSLSAVGFAPGDITTLQFLENWDLLPNFGSEVDVLVCVFDENTRKYSWNTANQLREAGIKTELYLADKYSMTSQLSYANKKEIRFVVIIGPEEISNENVQVKDLQTGEQTMYRLSDAIEAIQKAVTPVVS